jgi:hypothetical protein
VKREGKPASVPRAGLAASYRAIFNKVITVDVETRRDVLRDIYRELSQRPGEWTPGALLDELRSRYESKGLIRSKTLLLKIWQLGFHQRAYEYLGSASFSTPVELAEDIDSQAAFIRRAESGFVYAAVQSELEIDQAELAVALLNDRASVKYVQELLDDLEERGAIVRMDGAYRLPGQSENPLRDDANLRQVIHDLKEVQLPEDLGTDVETARELAQSGMAKRSNDFAASAQDFLAACRLQWDAVERQDPEATLEDLRWYIASYASVKAGELSQITRYSAAQPYYLAFFSLVQENTLLWNRMRRLINPVLHYCWKNLAREMGVELPYTTSPISTAIQMATHANPELQQKWEEATRQLAQVNPGVLRRVANQIRLIPEDSQQNIQVAEQIERMVES